MRSWPIPAGVAALLDTLRGAGCEAHPVGGCVRDLLLGRTPGDYDVCTSARPEQVMALFPRTLPTGLRHGTVTVLTESGAVEVTTFRREGGYADGRRPDGVRFDVGLAEDLSRRDFTVNAMALSTEGEVIDPSGGQADLARRQIRCVGDPDRRFAEDALRMLRAVRFAAQLDFSIEDATLAAIRRNAGRTARVSGERVKAEVEKILLSDRPERAGLLLELGLLEHLYPGPDGPGPVRTGGGAGGSRPPLAGLLRSDRISHHRSARIARPAPLRAPPRGGTGETAGALRRRAGEAGAGGTSDRPHAAAAGPVSSGASGGK